MYHVGLVDGRIRGIREVVEFGNRLVARAEFASRAGSKAERAMTMEIIRDWQAKLKEWVIDV